MKTTLDLPDDLVRQLKLHALMDGRKLKDAAADLLRAGLAARKEDALPAVIVLDKETGLPAIQTRHKALPGYEMTPEMIDDILLQQEVEWILNVG